jgi:hypothetical protein
MKKVAYAQRSRFNKPYAEILNYRRQEMNIKLWRANARMVLERIPTENVSHFDL